MKTLIRGALTSFAAVLLVLAAAGSARAQDTYAPQLPGPGTITNTSGILSGGNLTANAAAFQVPVVAAPAGSGGTGGGDSLAFTGAESDLIAAAGMGLLLVGGAAVIYSRRRD